MAKRKKRSRAATATTVRTTPPDIGRPRRERLLAAALLIVVTIIAFAPVASHPFVTLDDQDYVTHNDMVLKGMTGEGFGWAFTTFRVANWQPLMWLSLMTDVSLFGAKPGAMLMMNVVLHALAAAALFAALHALTGSVGRSLAVALLFALHPLDVQSVAWVSERKNLLCALFWFLAMWRYARYARSRKTGDYVLVAFFFALSLMAKPVAVTFPAALLLIDYWPLGRFKSGRVGALFAEKIPLFALSAISSALTFEAQRAAGGVRSFTHMPLGVRASNAVVSYARYLGKTFWPRALAVCYPYVSSPAAIVAAAVLALLAITAAAYMLRARWPFLLTGWLWFLGTLVPMIGIIQVGEQSMADRYTYIPLIGIFVALVWLAAELTQTIPQRREVRIAIVAALCLALAWRTHDELRYWRSSEELFTHALAVAGPSAVAHNALGGAYIEKGDVGDAEEQFRRALQVNPSSLDARVNLANALARQGRLDDAIAAYEDVLKRDSSLPDIHNNLGVALARQGRMSEAVPHFYEALRIDPHFAPAQQVLELLARQGVDVQRYR
jgi:tetratricopeptide (TPR) repeat protein